MCERIFDFIPCVFRQEYYEDNPDGNDMAAAKYSNKKLKVLSTRCVVPVLESLARVIR